MLLDWLLCEDISTLSIVTNCRGTNQILNSVIAMAIMKLTNQIQKQEWAIGILSVCSAVIGL